MRIASLSLLAVLVLFDGAILAQSASAPHEGAERSSPQEAPEEIIVRGRRLTELRFELELARERAYDIFNEINSDDDFDVYCRDEARTGTRATQRVCRAQFENRISSAAGQEYLGALLWACRGSAGVTQDCMFSDASAAAISRAQGVEGQLPGKREQMNDEILRLANQDDRFAQAILDWYEASQQYEAARKRRSD